MPAPACLLVVAVKSRLYISSKIKVSLLQISLESVPKFIRESVADKRSAPAMTWEAEYWKNMMQNRQSCTGYEFSY